MAAFSTLDPCEAVMQDAAVQVSIDDLLYVGSQKSILFGKAIIIDPFKFLFASPTTIHHMIPSIWILYS